MIFCGQRPCVVPPLRVVQPRRVFVFDAGLLPSCAVKAVRLPTLNIHIERLFASELPLVSVQLYGRNVVADGETHLSALSGSTPDASAPYIQLSSGPR